MKFTGLSTPEIIAVSFSKLHQSHRQTVPTAETKLGPAKRRTAKRPTAKNPNWEYPSTELHGKESRSNSKPDDYAEQDLCDAMEVVKCVGKLPALERMWSLYAYTEDYEHYHGEIVNNVMKQLNRNHFEVFQEWQANWERFGQVYRLIAFLMAAVRQRTEITNISMARVIGLSDEGNFRPSRSWGKLKSAIDDVQNQWDRVSFGEIEETVIEMKNKRNAA